jgi:hypothetical protein
MVLASNRISLFALCFSNCSPSQSSPGNRKFITKESDYLLALARLLYETGRLRGNINRLQFSLLQYYLFRDTKSQAELEEERFKGRLLIQRPDIYNEIYKPSTPFDTEGYRVLHPQNEGDVMTMLDDLKDAGILGE